MAKEDQALAKAIKQARTLADMTQPEAVAQAGVGITTWSMTERGTPPATPEKLAAMARVIGMEASQLRGLGYSDAAELVEAAEHAPAKPVNKFEAVVEAQKLLLNAGWSVTLKSIGDGYEMVITGQ